MFKRSFLLGIVAGALAGVAAVIYQRVYNSSLEDADFSAIVKPVGIVAASLIGCLLASIAYLLLTRWLKNTGEIIFNFLFVILSFASILFVFSARLPMNLAKPELFPGLAIPMHFFPALAWLTLKPLFIKNS
jgi:ABC-type transport system involved in cytochrome c biogenesis permease subunit